MFFFWLEFIFIDKSNEVFLFNFQGINMVITEPHHQTTIKYLFISICRKPVLLIVPYKDCLQIKNGNRVIFQYLKPKSVLLHSFYQPSVQNFL